MLNFCVDVLKISYFLNGSMHMRFYVNSYDFLALSEILKFGHTYQKRNQPSSYSSILLEKLRTKTLHNVRVSLCNFRPKCAVTCIDQCLSGASMLVCGVTSFFKTSVTVIQPMARSSHNVCAS